MTRAVLDTNVLVAAVLSPEGSPADCVRAHAEGRFELVVSEALLAELARVLRRSKFRRYLTADQADRYVEALRREGMLVKDPEEIAPASVDPKDDYLVALARSAGAHVLVSGDVHLTSLETDVRVITPREFLAVLP